MNKEELKELAATLNGIADGKAWEYLSTGDGDDFWTDPGSLDIGFCLFNCSGIRLKPWSLPPPPDGMKWHRDDWTEEMLPEGWRPLLRGEPRVLGDEFLFDKYERSSEWIDCSGPPVTLNSPDVNWCHHRTKRPLPQPDPYAELKAAHAAGKVIQHNRGNGSYPNWCDVPDPEFSDRVSTYRIKPEQQKVPFQPSDVLPFCVFRFKGFNDLLTPFCVKDERVYFFSDTSHCWGYEWLMRNAEINRSIPLTGKWNPEAWEFCYKLIDTP
jgi:hypothetical protein